MSWVGEERIESLCDVNYVDIGFIYQIICRQVQRNPNTYKWSVMGVPLIEILILIVFGHLRDPVPGDRGEGYDVIWLSH